LSNARLLAAQSARRSHVLRDGVVETDRRPAAPSGGERQGARPAAAGGHRRRRHPQIGSCAGIARWWPRSTTVRTHGALVVRAPRRTSSPWSSAWHTKTRAGATRASVVGEGARP